MQGISGERRDQQVLALKPLGITPRLNRFFSGQVGALGADAAIMALPFAGNSQALQDPTTGEFYAMYDIDAYGVPYAP